MDDAEAGTSDEQYEVGRRRYTEARRAGLTIVEATLFAESDADVGELRRLVQAGCPVEQLRAIVL